MEELWDIHPAQAHGKNDVSVESELNACPDPPTHPSTHTHTLLIDPAHHPHLSRGRESSFLFYRMTPVLSPPNKHTHTHTPGG